MENQINNTTENLQSTDYYINYYGQMIDIKNCKKILCLFVNGGGYGDGGADRTWYSHYDLYLPNEKDFGKTLVKIGEASENGNGYDVSSKFAINGDTHCCNGISVDSFFNNIFKRNSLV